MTKTAKDVRGVLTTRKAVVVEPKETNWDRKNMSYEEAIKDNERIKEERRAAEQAALEVRKKYQRPGAMQTVSKAEQSADDATLDQKRKELAESEAALKANPTNKTLKKKINDLNAEIDALEDASEN